MTVPDLKECLDVAAESYRRMKIEAVAERGICDIPSLTMAFTDDRLMVLTGGFEDQDQRRHVLSLIGFAFRPQTLCLCSEAFMKVGGPDNPLQREAYKPGELGREFASGEQSVSEVLMFSGADDEDVITRQQPFHYDVAKLVLDETVEIPDSVGAISDDLSVALTIAREATKDLGPSHDEEREALMGVLRQFGWSVELLTKDPDDKESN